MRRLAFFVVVLACSNKQPAPVADSGPIAETPWFREIGASSGIVNIRPEVEYARLEGRMGGGVCALDVNGDGLLDLFFPGISANGGGGSRLYVSTGRLQWTDRAGELGVANTGSSSGCVAVDLDGDGDSDLVTTGLGGARLFRNEGGKFAEQPLGTFAPDLVTTAVVAFDADGDGDLDLAIAAYGRFRADGKTCMGPCESDIRQYQYGSSTLLFQQPDGTFVDETARLGTLAEPGLVAMATDLDEDGNTDLFVGNDIASFPDRYYRGDGKGSFTEVSKTFGVAFNAQLSGIYTMSATEGDVDGDGHLDLAESSWDEEPSAIFRCLPTGCTEMGETYEMFRTPRNFRWGQAIVDFDDDGVTELFEAMGHYQISTDAKGSRFPVSDVSLLWSHRDGKAPFVRAPALDGLAAKAAGRGVIAVDLDNDGDLDVVVGAAIGRPLILENIRAGRGHALNVRLRGKGKNREAIGARVTVRAGGKTFPAMVHAGGSFHSSDAARVHVGLGTATVAEVEIRWPSGGVTKREGVPADQLLTIDE